MHVCLVTLLHLLLTSWFSFVAILCNLLLPLTIYHFFGLFCLFKKKCMLIWSPSCLCDPLIRSCMSQPIFMKLGTYIMAPEPIRMVYFINALHQSVCLCILLSFQGNSSITRFRRQRGIVGGTVSYAVRVISKGSRRIISSQNFHYLIFSQG
jgi:hypothetical protein